MGKPDHTREQAFALWHHRKYFSIPDNDNCKCPLCNDDIKYKDMLSHVSLHDNSSLSCAKCKRSFNGESETVAHLITHVRRRPFICLKCKMAFMHEEEMIGHLGHSHGIHYKCPFCKIEFLSVIDIEQHLHVSHAAELKSGKSDFDHEIPSGIDVIDEGKKHKFIIGDHCKYYSFDDTYQHSCPFCEMKCRYKELRPHLLKHELNNAECHLCQKMFASKGGLFSHILHFHITQCPYQCLECNKKIKTAHLLRSHLLKAHNVLYRCSICNEKFGKIQIANLHAMKHHGNTQNSIAGSSKTLISSQSNDTSCTNIIDENSASVANPDDVEIIEVQNQPCNRLDIGYPVESGGALRMLGSPHYRKAQEVDVHVQNTQVDGIQFQDMRDKAAHQMTYENVCHRKANEETDNFHGIHVESVQHQSILEDTMPNQNTQEEIMHVQSMHKEAVSFKIVQNVICLSDDEESPVQCEQNNDNQKLNNNKGMMLPSTTTQSSIEQDLPDDDIMILESDQPPQNPLKSLHTNCPMESQRINDLASVINERSCKMVASPKNPCHHSNALMNNSVGAATIAPAIPVNNFISGNKFLPDNFPVISHSWILDGNDKQYNLALQYEKSVIQEWMSMVLNV